MIRTNCLVCGSSNMRADRALSGRLVCTSCGTPFGDGRRMRNKKNVYGNFSLKNNKYLIFICLFIFAFILIII